MLLEETTLNNIQATVAQAYIEFQESQVGNPETHIDGAEAYRNKLAEGEKASRELEEQSLRKVEQLPSGDGKITHSKRDDPHFRLVAQKIVPFILDLERQQQELDALLQRSRN